MKVVDILNTQHTLLYTASGYTNGTYKQVIETLKHILVDIPELIKDNIFKLRALGYDTDEYKEAKKHYPNWIVSGTYPFGNVKDEATIGWSNLIAIDIDKHDNNSNDLMEIRKQIFELPYVVAVPKSISGLGIYAIILVEDGRYTKEYYKYITRLWNKKYGLNIDTQCSNIARKRFIGYDEEIHKWIKPDDEDIQPWTLKYIEKKPEPVKNNHIIISKYQVESQDKEYARKAIWKLLNSGYSIDNMNTSPSTSYGAWYHVACDFRHFDDGLEMFIKFSQNSSAYNDNITSITKKYNNAKVDSSYDDVSKKWCGICKRIYGPKWWRD